MRRVGFACLCFMVVAGSKAAVAQSSGPLSIPLQFVDQFYRLGINVGVAGNAPRLYLFDTGSSSFNAVTSNSIVPLSSVINGTLNGNGGPSTAGLTTNAFFPYGTGTLNYTTNLIKVPSLQFYNASSSQIAAQVAGSSGFQMASIVSRVLQTNNPNGTLAYTTTQTFNLNGTAGCLDCYTQTTVYADGKTPTTTVTYNISQAPEPFPGGALYGTFGAGYFLVPNLVRDPTTQTNVDNGTYSGGILGQTIVSGPNIRQGYVVAANGQANPFSTVNGPQAPNGSSVTVGGQSGVAITNCSPCVTVGLTPALLGQFMPGSPTNSGALLGWMGNSFGQFPNPYGGSTGNNSGREFGINLNVTLTPPGSSTASFNQTSGGLLDTGTQGYMLASGANGYVRNGVTLGVTGAGPGNAQVPGLTTSTTVLDSANQAYAAAVGSSSTNTIGLSFFLQNSVMFDLDDQLVGYTPFFVTLGNIQTTANGPLIVNGSNVALGLAGVISGPGGVTVQAGGQIQTSALNTYTGVTTIGGASGGQPAGVLLVSGPGSIASSSGVVNNGFFDISRAWGPVSVQTLSGSGQTYLGGGNLVLTNASGTYSGTISDGGAYPVAGGSLTLAGGTFTLAGIGNYTGGTYVTGGTFALAGTLFGGLAVMPAGSFTIVPGGVLNNAGGATVNYGQLIVGGTLQGTVYNAGSAVVNGLVNGSVSNIGTLAGSGTIAGNLVNNGVVAPGSGVGTLSVGGNFTNMSSGVLSIEAMASGQGDLLNVGGSATLQGGAVSLYAVPGTNYAARTTYRVLNAAGGVNGTFASIVDPYPFLLSSLSYDASNAYLTLQIGGFAATAATPAQFAVGAVLDANVFNATGDFAQVLSALATGIQSAQAGQYALQSLSGNNYAGFSSFGVQSAQLFMNNFGSQAGGGGSPASTRVALAEACDVACDTVTPAKWGAWGGGLGGLGTIGGNAPVGGVTYNAGGFAAGLDRLVTDTLRVGVTAGYTAGTQWVNGFSGVGRSNTFQTGVYANFAQDKVYADALLGYAYTWNQMWRQISIPGLQPRTAMGQAGVNQFFGQLETGYRFDIGPLGAVAADAFITPFARLQAYTGDQNAFTETGAQSLNLTINGQGTNSLRTVLGAQIGGAMDLGWREKLAMVLRLGWSHEYADVSRPVTATLAGAPAMPFTTFGISPQRDGALLGLSANTAVAEAVSVYFRYEGLVSGQDNAHAFTAGLRMTW